MTTTLSAEQRILGALTIRAATRGDLLGELLPAADADTLAGLAEREGLAGLLYANLKRADLVGSLPQPIKRDLGDLYRYIAAANMHRCADLARLLEAIAGNGVEVFVIKGMALLETLYDDPGVRPTGDVDLYVDERNLQPLLAVLRDSGYEAQPFYPDVYRRGATSIDIHTHLLGAERVRARELIFAAGEGPMFAGSEACGYGPGRRLAAPQHLFLLGLHFLKHNAERLLWLIEINELACDCSAEDWKEVLELGNRMGQSASIRQVAFLAALLLPNTVAERYRSLAGDGELGSFQARVLLRRATHGRLPAWGPLVFFAPQAGMRKRILSVLETLFPRPATLRQIFRDPRTSLWRLHVRRFGQLVGWMFR